MPVLNKKRKSGKTLSRVPVNFYPDEHKSVWAATTKWGARSLAEMALIGIACFEAATPEQREAARQKASRKRGAR